MEEITTTAITSGLDVGNLFGTGALGAVVLAAIFIFLNWKTSSRKNIKERKKAYNEKTEIAEKNIEKIVTQDIVKVDEQIQVIVKDIEVKKDQIDETIVKGNETITATLKEEKVKNTGKRITSKWNQI
jgi:hypothetical protein